MSSPLIRPSLESRNNGITAITTDDERWGRCDIKSISLLANVLARQKANEEHTNEAILIKDDKTIIDCLPLLVNFPVRS